MPRAIRLTGRFPADMAVGITIANSRRRLESRRRNARDQWTPILELQPHMAPIDIKTAENPIHIDWDQHPACGLSRAIEALTLAFVHFSTFQRLYLRALPVEPVGTPRPLALANENFGIPLLSDVEIERVNGFKSRKRQTEWMAGRLAAKTLAQRATGHAAHLPDIGIAYHPEGAPYLEHRPDLALSISHGGDYAVAGLPHTPETVLGLDIEKEQVLDIESILPVAFSDRERRRLDPADRHRFFECWTLKEAYLKYLGRGFRENLKTVEILAGTTICHAGQTVADLQARTFQPFPGYTLAVVTGPRP